MPLSKLPPPSYAVPARVGVVGTGFIAAGLCQLLRTTYDLSVTRVLTRRCVSSIPGMSSEQLTTSIDDLVENSDVIVECSGDIAHACAVIQAAHAAGRPVVTMGSEFHVTAGSYYAGTGLLTEAEGDQPGSLAALFEEAVQMGFKPVVYGNIKGFLNHNPTVEDMIFWSERNGISQAQVTSFTDGTKLQIEQALVGNGLGADIVKRGMIGPRDLEMEEAGRFLGQEATKLGRPITDYVLNRKLPAGVFFVGEHPSERPEVLRYLKLGDGPYYTLLRPYHLCHLEMPRTIRRVLEGRGVLLNNSVRPHLHVVAVAKTDLSAGTLIETAIGGTELRGECVRLSETRDCPPIGLLYGARLRHSVAAGQTLSHSDVDIPDSLVKKAWESILDQSADLA